MKARPATRRELILFHREQARHHSRRAQTARAAVKRETEAANSHKAAILRLEKEPPS